MGGICDVSLKVLGAPELLHGALHALFDELVLSTPSAHVKPVGVNLLTRRPHGSGEPHGLLFLGKVGEQIVHRQPGEDLEALDRKSGSEFRVGDALHQIDEELIDALILRVRENISR